MAHAESSQPERKRPRLSPEDEAEDEKPFVNHATLYFDDGNVILGAGRTLFCVHRSLLAKHSIVFRDLFDQPHDRFRGVLHVRMEETADEVEALLNVVYDGLRFDIQDLTIETFPTLANVLRMATKYKIDRPCADIIARIRTEWPATLAQHDAKESEFRARLLKIYGAADARHGPDQGGHAAQAAAAQEEDLIVHPASVIALLRECGYHDTDLLFPLFYALSRTTWQFGGPTLGHNLAGLSPADTERLVVGIERLRVTHIAFASAVPEFALQPTHPPHFCSPGAAHFWSVMLQSFVQTTQRRSREPLEEWRDFIPLASSPPPGYQICALCARSIASKIEAIRQSLWASLPAFFELA